MNTLNGQTIRGAGGGGKGGGGGHTPTEASDSLRSKQYAHILDLLSEGEIYGLVNGAKSVFYNEVALQNADGSFNFQDVHLAWANGTQTQINKALGSSSINFGLEDVRSENAVQVEILAATPVVRTIIDANTTYAIVTIGIPTLLSRNADNGDTTGTAVGITIDVQANGGGFVNLVNDSINGKTTSRYQRSYSIALAGSAPWDIRVSRTTADSHSQMLVNNTFFDSYTAVISTHLSYPNSAIVAASIDSQQFQSIPTRAFEIKGLLVRVPSNYDPVARTYTGIWDGTFKIAWTDNPAWVYYDLVTNTRYGLGTFIDASQVDKWSLYTVSQYCDQLVPSGLGNGVYEPRFTCNLYLQTQAEAFTVVQNMASVFRAITFWSTGALTVVQDAPASISALYTNANVIDGTFTYVGSSIKARHTVALVTWNDPTNFYKQVVEYVQDDAAIAKYGSKPASIVAFGCTSRGQAHRLGKWLLYSEANETEVVTFKASLDGFQLYPGALINTSDLLRARTRMGGRIKAFASNVLTLDSTVTIVAGKTYSIAVILEDGTIFNSAVAGAVGDTNLLTLYSAPPAAPLVNAIFIVAANDLVPEVWRVVSVVESDKCIVEVSAVKHAPEKFALIEQGIQFDPKPIGLDTITKQKITNIAVSESLYVIASGHFGIKTLVSWSSTAARFKLRYRRTDGGSWTSVTVMEPAADLSGMSQAKYVFEVTAIDGFGRNIDSSTYTYTVLGLLFPPASVTGFVSSVEGFGTRLSWNNNTEVDLDHYEIRVGGTSWANATTVSSISANTLLLAPQIAGTFTYRIKAVNTSGIYSVNETDISVVIAPPTIVAIVAKIVGAGAVLTWAPAGATYSVDHYEIRYGASFATGTVLDRPKAAAFKETVNYGGTRTYWIAAVDVAGNVGAPSSVDVTISNPLAVTVTSQVIDNNVLLNWSDSTTTLPIQRYEVRKGATWAVGAQIGDNGNGRFAAFFEQSSGLYTYWVMATDSAGNTGTPTNITATVNQPPDYVLRLDYQTNFSGLTYEFDQSASVQGWVPTGATETAANGTLTVTSTGTTPVIARQMNDFTLYGCEYPTIQVRLRRIAGAGWIGNCDYDTAGHGYTAGFYAHTADAAPAIGEEKVITFDMTNLAAGGQDWNASIINDLRFDLGATAADIFEIDWIKLIPYKSSNVTVDNGNLYAALTTESWQSHFTSKGWSTPQDQINAGFPYFWEQSNTVGYYEEILNYGTVLNSTSVTTTLTSTVILGNVAVTPTLSYKLNWTDAWTDKVGVTSIVAQNFQFVKIRYDFASVGGANMLQITNIDLKISSKTKNDAGNGNALATDSVGTIVNFNIAFIDVTSISITGKGTTAPVIAIYDFLDIPNPTFFKVYLYDKTGARVSGAFSWAAKGV